jgi:hypothetical protein
MPPLLLASDPAAGRDRAEVEALIEVLATVVQTAGALLSEGHRLDLTGLDSLVGLLCARALDLDPRHGCALGPTLLALRDDLDGLFAALAPGGLN